MAKVVVVGALPINQPDSDVLLANIRPDLDPVAEQVVDRAVGVVECLAAAECSGLVQFAQDLGDDTVGVPLALEPVGQQILLDVAVVGAVLPVAKVGVAEGVPEERDHALLGEDFPLTDGAHDAGPKVGITLTPVLSVDQKSLSRVCRTPFSSAQCNRPRDMGTSRYSSAAEKLASVSSIKRNDTSRTPRWTRRSSGKSADQKGLQPGFADRCRLRPFPSVMHSAGRLVESRMSTDQNPAGSPFTNSGPDSCLRGRPCAQSRLAFGPLPFAGTRAGTDSCSRLYP